MKALWIFLGLYLLLSFLASPSASASSKIKAPSATGTMNQDSLAVLKSKSLESLPDKTLHTHPGYKIKDLKGSVVLVDFWATWCEPCKESLRLYEKLHQKYQKQGLKVIAFSADDKAAEAVAYLSKNPVSFAVYFDQDRKYTDAFDVSAVPTLFILDQDLRIQETFQGHTPRKLEALEKKIQSLLQQAEPKK